MFTKLFIKDKQLFVLLLLIVLLIAGLVAFTGWQGSQLTINWSTESELDIIGFNLYRADSADGDYIKINDFLIPPAADPFIGGDHQFIDRNVRWGSTYYYKLETIDRYGNSEMTSPIELRAGW